MRTSFKKTTLFLDTLGELAVNELMNLNIQST